MNVYSCGLFLRVTAVDQREHIILPTCAHAILRD